MKNNIYLLILFIALFLVQSCKKGSQPPPQQSTQTTSLEKGLLNFSIKGQLFNTVIDTGKNMVTVIIPHTLNQHSIPINFSLAANVSAAIQNNAVSDGAVVDFSKEVYLTVTSADKKRSTTFLLNVETDLFYYGLSGNLVSEKSLNKDYSYYFDQFDGSTWQAVNCGPTTVTMAIKWADSTFNKTPLDARHTYIPQGGWWGTNNIDDYLRDNKINHVTDTITDLEGQVKNSIDNNNPIILCLDMYYVSFDDVTYQHLNRFYIAGLPGWGHFILVKGYKQMSTGFYLEVYDPYSQNRTYSPSAIAGERMGQDRYYSSADIKKATDVWYPYVDIIAAKGQQVTASTTLKVNSLGNHKPIPVAYGR